MKRTPSSPAESTPPDELVSERAGLTAEEKQAGVDDPAALAKAVLAESESRTLDRSQATEHRHSEDTVEPPD
jgi:hypothetical protein